MGDTPEQEPLKLSYEPTAQKEKPANVHSSPLVARTPSNVSLREVPMTPGSNGYITTAPQSVLSSSSMSTRYQPLQQGHAQMAQHHHGLCTWIAPASATSTPNAVQRASSSPALASPGLMTARRGTKIAVARPTNY